VTTVWLVRAGEHSRLVREFARNGVIALGWSRIPGLGDLEGLDRDEIAGLIAVSGRTQTPAADAGELLAFRDTMKIGDLVVTPDSTTREVLIGHVTGDYQYLDPSPAGDYHHVRSVTWLRRWPRDRIGEELLVELRYRRTIRQLTHRQEWAAIVEQPITG